MERQNGLESRTKQEVAPINPTSQETAEQLQQPIGGFDLIFDNLPGAAGCDFACRVIRQHWLEATFTDAETDEAYRYGDIPFATAKHLFVNRNPHSDCGLYLIAGEKHLTVACADLDSEVISSLRSCRLPGLSLRKGR